MSPRVHFSLMPFMGHRYIMPYELFHPCFECPSVAIQFGYGLVEMLSKLDKVVDVLGVCCYDGG